MANVTIDNLPQAPNPLPDSTMVEVEISNQAAKVTLEQIAYSQPDFHYYEAPLADPDPWVWQGNPEEPVWETVFSDTTIVLTPGSYLGFFTMSWSAENTNRNFNFRFVVDGVPRPVFSFEPNEVADRIPFTTFVLTPFVAGAHLISLEAQVEAGGGATPNITVWTSRYSLDRKI